MPDTIDALNDFISDLYKKYGHAITDDMVRMMAERLGGFRITLPGTKSLFRAERNRRIQHDFDGRNYQELAFRHGLCVRQLRNIIHGKKRNRSAQGARP